MAITKRTVGLEEPLYNGDAPPWAAAALDWKPQAVSMPLSVEKNPPAERAQGQPEFVTMFCDASFCPQTKAYGWAMWAKHGTPATTERESGSGQGALNSTDAELVALTEGIKALIRNEVPIAGRIIVIQSDSTGALNKLDIKPLKLAGARFVKLKHVKGHQGLRNPRAAVNTWCDTEAKRRMRAVRDKIQYPHASHATTELRN